jgi:putative flippase GtrA
MMHSEAPEPDPESERSLLQGLQRPWLGQFVRFGLVGLLNTAVDGGFYFVLTRWVGLGDQRVLAKAMSYFVAVLNSYFWNRSWTFRSRGATRSTLLPFVLSNLLGLAISSGVMYVGLHPFQLVDGLAVILSMSATFFWNFSISKLVVFRER